VFERFKANVKGRPGECDALTAAVAKAEVKVAADRTAELD
jgi:hypothetical protein